MKIRYLLLHAYGTGGTIRTVLTQAGWMAEAGHEVEVVSAVRRRTTPGFPIPNGVRLCALVDQRAGIAAPRLHSRVLRRLRGHVVPRGEPAAAYFTPEVEAAIARWMRGLSEGVLVTTRPALNLLAVRHASSRVLMVAQEHMNYASHRQAVQRAIRRGYGRFDAVTVLTETDRADYERVLPGARIVRIPNAVHPMERALADHTSTIAVAAGRLVPQKGFDLLIPAFQRATEAHRDWRLRIFGAGVKRAELAALAAPRVELMGRSDAFHRELAASALYVLSSRFEGLPMVMIEAMAHGLPVVAFDCPTGPREVITHDVDGVLVPPQDVDALARAITELIEDEPRRRRLGAQAVRTVEAYSTRTVAPKWLELFNNLQTARRGVDHTPLS
ncbi:glycosyltransferase family 4 protein [Nonomuraea africana]|uniref:Glycosyltransferase involved in cell wall biosynthesis n=1 Tax=Nonomuraea africana TaxID=46171 RepID=A0ABR9KFZ1_9ACTN|nr:glycosyltransferase family 4 protein [Nonomuraea africana]MBE1560946.1 glycosyltransferase involved in cell wall biosynthesis [Nonomuraea africana]